MADRTQGLRDLFQRMYQTTGRIVPWSREGERKRGKKKTQPNAARSSGRREAPDGSEEHGHLVRRGVREFTPRLRESGNRLRAGRFHCAFTSLAPPSGVRGYPYWDDLRTLGSSR